MKRKIHEIIFITKIGIQKELSNKTMNLNINWTNKSKDKIESSLLMYVEKY